MALGLPRPEEKAAVVQAMFDRIAHRYDLLNRVLTLGCDQRWRRTAVRRAAIASGDFVVDLGCGTGDMCVLAAATGARVVGIDFAAGMLVAARQRRAGVPVVRADAAALPLPTACASAVTSAFALRNFDSIRLVLQEAARVLRIGGRLALLEVDQPTGPLRRWGHAMYFKRLVPLVGGLLSDRAAYAYLPRSAVYLPREAELLELVARAGFSRIEKHALGGGAAQLVLATRVSLNG